MNILGISAGFHDAAVTSIQSGEIVFAGHAERYSKIKHDATLHSDLISDAVLALGCCPDQLAYYERPLYKRLRQLYAGQYQDAFSLVTVRQQINQASPDIDLSKVSLKTYNHHLSHAAAGFQTSPFEEATVVVIDAIGEWDTISIWRAHYNRKGLAKYHRVWRQTYPHSIGLMYSAFTRQVGLRPLDEEYILMGMSAYENDRQLSYQFKEWLVNNESTACFNYNFHLGLPTTSGIDKLDEFVLAAAAQDIAEDLISAIMYKAWKLGRSKNLVYMGGVALNCLANRMLGDHFDNIWIMPNPGDAGSSLGAAALVYGKKLNWQGPYLGHNIPGEYPVGEALSELLRRQIVGVANGPAEFGPRALGNRSLLADPRGNDIKDRVNEIKRRQKFRPFAPVILEEYVDQYFEMPAGFTTSPYMQTVAKCLRPKEFPAIIHIDGTSRVQTVSKDSASGIRQLLEAWHVWTGCPMLLNTSLNIRGEPMVNDRMDAQRFENLYGIRVLS